MRIFITLIMTLFVSFSSLAQVPHNGQNRLSLLKELHLSPSQKMQLSELIQEERLQEYLRKRRLNQILSPEQKRKLSSLKKQPAAATGDSLFRKENH